MKTIYPQVLQIDCEDNIPLKKDIDRREAKVIPAVWGVGDGIDDFEEKDEYYKGYLAEWMF